MLKLVRLNANRNNDIVEYAKAIRSHLDEHDGQLPEQRLIEDPLGSYSLRI